MELELRAPKHNKYSIWYWYMFRRKSKNYLGPYLLSASATAHHMKISARQREKLGVRPVLAENAEDGPLRTVVPGAIPAGFAHVTLRAGCEAKHHRQVPRAGTKGRGADLTASLSPSTIVLHYF